MAANLGTKKIQISEIDKLYGGEFGNDEKYNVQK
jgi:hypothetical protein